MLIRLSDSSPKGRGKKWRKKENKGEQNLLWGFFAREKMATAHGSFADIRPWQLGLPRKQLRRPRQVEQMSFSAVCPTNSTVRRSNNYKNRYNLYVLSRNFVRALRSSRTTEYYVLLNLRTIEKQKDWIWIGFQSGPAIFVRTIENYVL